MTNYKVGYQRRYGIVRWLPEAFATESEALSAAAAYQHAHPNLEQVFVQAVAANE